MWAWDSRSWLRKFSRASSGIRRSRPMRTDSTAPPLTKAYINVRPMQSRSAASSMVRTRCSPVVVVMVPGMAETTRFDRCLPRPVASQRQRDLGRRAVLTRTDVPAADRAARGLSCAGRCLDRQLIRRRRHRYRRSRTRNPLTRGAGSREEPDRHLIASRRKGKDYAPRHLSPAGRRAGSERPSGLRRWVRSRAAGPWLPGPPVSAHD